MHLQVNDILKKMRCKYASLKKGRRHGQQSILERSKSSNGLALFRNGRHRSSTNRVTLLSSSSSQKTWKKLL